MSSTFGTLFRVSTFGESHCRGVGAIVDGFPPQLDVSEEAIQKQLSRRRPGQSDLATPRDEKDKVSILSGTENGISLGTPIAFLVENENQRPSDYAEMSSVPRPSHADYTYLKKYGIKASSGGGRSSARETIGRVAAGALAEIFLGKMYGIEIVAYVSSVGSITMEDIDIETVTRNDVDSNIVRCPDPKSYEKMHNLILEAKNGADSVGGVVSCVCRNLPAGWGEPVFDKLEARLAQAMLSIPATKGFEIGSGFLGATMFGSQHNDRFIVRNGKIGTATNFSGGIQGGISNGETVYFRVAFKPPATIGKAQATIDFDGNEITLEAKGRHDPCVVPRAVPVVESMAALVLADMALIQSTRNCSSIL